MSSFGPSRERIDHILRDNPHIRFGDPTQRGYVVVDVTAESCVARFRVVEDATDPATGVGTRAAFVVERGRPGPQPA